MEAQAAAGREERHRWLKFMAHTTKVIDAKQINNEYVVYTVQCCEDPMEITNHTIHVLAADHAGQLDTIKAGIATRHEAVLAWRKANGI